VLCSGVRFAVVCQDQSQPGMVEKPWDTAVRKQGRKTADRGAKTGRIGRLSRRAWRGVLYSFLMFMVKKMRTRGGRHCMAFGLGTGSQAFPTFTSNLEIFRTKRVFAYSIWSWVFVCIALYSRSGM